ncbi:hypothetical protein [Streptomyces sp. PT12]|uniref:hypothetical protein n=1 Tax=Streptomyces sp. PT12 TaxID=1510197 RepID=UPI000DE436AE|nr:hypothetical protein [Streptomyces sp. PT12]RBM07338.1 hypothetical protein DEH69_25165 [Streptomyces sp. PT12]
MDRPPPAGRLAHRDRPAGRARPDRGRRVRPRGGQLAFGSDGFLYWSIGDGNGDPEADGSYSDAVIGEMPTQVTAFGAAADGESYVVNDLPGQLFRVGFGQAATE